MKFLYLLRGCVSYLLHWNSIWKELCEFWTSWTNWGKMIKFHPSSLYSSEFNTIMNFCERESERNHQIKWVGVVIYQVNLPQTHRQIMVTFNC